MRGILAVTGLVLLAACGVGEAHEGKAAAMSGSGTTRSVDARGFDRVALRGPDNVIVRVGGRESVTASGPTDVLDQLEIEVVNGELRVGRQRHFGMNWSGPRGHATVTVTLPRLVGAAVAGSGDMQVDRAEAPSFSVAVAGSGNLRIENLIANSADFDIAGSGNATVGGRAQRLDVNVAGSGDLDGRGLRAETAKIAVMGSGTVKAGVEQEADVSVMGSGDVDITGRAHCRVSKMGSGAVRCAS